MFQTSLPYLMWLPNMLDSAENVALKLFNIVGARALVTDGGSGLGKAMATALRDAGAQVAIVGRSETLLTGKKDFVPVMPIFPFPRLPSK